MRSGDSSGNRQAPNTIPQTPVQTRMVCGVYVRFLQRFSNLNTRIWMDSAVSRFAQPLLIAVGALTGWPSQI